MSVTCAVCGQPIGGQVCKEKWDELYMGMSHFITVFMQNEVNVLNNKHMEV
jgi:hypothetical protein